MAKADRDSSDIEERLKWLEANTIKFEFAWEKELRLKEALQNRITELEKENNELQSILAGYVGRKDGSRRSSNNSPKRSTVRRKVKGSRG